MDLIERCCFGMKEGIVILRKLLLDFKERDNIWFVDVGFLIFVLKVY